MRPRFNKAKEGIGLIEAVVGVAVFLIVAVSVYSSFAKMFDVVRLSRLKVRAAAIINEELEIIRNLPYADVGLVGGIPPGRVQSSKDVLKYGSEFNVTTVIRNIDDPFDGAIGGSPNDLSPADYKLVEMTVYCLACRNFTPLTFTTHVAPKNLETASTNGALFIRVFDANGNPLPGASVHIENGDAEPDIVIDDTTDNNGMLQLVDVPPGVEAYEITVTKTGYSTDRTYPSGEPQNPNPNKPHATVVVQQVTQLSFAIDKLSTLNIASVSDTCSPVPGIDFTLAGSKLTGTNPDVLKYTQPHVTDSSGSKVINNLEWDTYNFSFTDSDYYLAGSIPLTPVNLSPNATQDVKLIITPQNPRSLLVTVKDASTQLPLTDTAVRLERGSYDETLTTNRGSVRQTDWSGGAGQEDFTTPDRYFDSDGSIEISSPPGELKLRRVLGDYLPSGWLISSTFDIGAPGNFHQIIWQPQDQPPQAGSDSVRFQIATNNDKATWNFLGPDGTVNTYYTLSDTNINPVHNGQRYIRYKIFIRTQDTSFTPNVSDIAITFTSSCVPPGQVLFSGLAAGDYTFTATKTGYQIFTDTPTITSPWQQYEIMLIPQ